MKKILVIGNYFYPDVASLGQLITDLCIELKEEFEFTVIASIPNYSEDLNISKDKLKLRYYDEVVKGIKVRRIIVPNVNKKNKLSRIKYIYKYYFNSKKAIKDIQEYDVIYTVSQPPILGGLLGKYAKKINKNAKLIYNIQDFNPEQIEAINYSKSKILIKILKYIDSITLKYADKILVVGHDQVETVKKRKAEFLKKTLVINNWTDDKNIYPLNSQDVELNELKRKLGLENKFIIMYSGNIGLFYDLENLIEVTKEFNEIDDLVFLFVGEGAVKDSLVEFKEKNNLKNIVFAPYQPKEKLNISLNLADVHLVVNAKGIKGVSVPSKLYGVMAAGKPVIGVLEEETEARIIIEKSNCGKCVEPENYNGFSELIREFYENREELDIMGNNSREYLDLELRKEKSISKYKELFDNI